MVSLLSCRIWNPQITSLSTQMLQGILFGFFYATSHNWQYAGHLHTIWYPPCNVIVPVCIFTVLCLVWIFYSTYAGTRSVYHNFPVYCKFASLLTVVFCYASFTHSTLRHHCSGVCAGLDGTSLETTHFHRRRWHHWLLHWLPWGHWRSPRKMARGEY